MSEPVNDNTNINSLSDKEMFTIFNSLPLHDFIQLQLVCKRWKIIHDIVCRSKNDLSLYSRSYINDFRDMSGLLYWSNSIYATKFENYAFCIDNQFLFKKQCHLLVAKFPNVKCFSVYGVQIRPKHLFYLLNHWSNLERITLVFGDDFEPSDWQAADWNQFWKALNKLKFLKHLAFPELDHQPNGFKSIYQSEIWPQLESVYITVNCDLDAKTLLEMFENIQPNLKSLTLKNLEIDPFDNGNNLNEWENKFKSLSENKPNVFAQLTNVGFQFEFSGLNFRMLQFICNRFVSLTHLNIGVEFKLSLVEMVPLLAQLRQLTSLRIALEDDMDYDDDSNYDPSDTENFEPNIGEKNYKNKYNENYSGMRSHGFFSDLTPKTYTQKLTTKLESIRFLYLANFDIFRWNLFDYFRVTFTNVERINFENCEFPLKRKRKNKKLCRRLVLLRAFRRFTKLKRIYRNNELLLDIGKITRDKEEVIVENTMKELFRTRPKYNSEYSTDYSYDDDDYGLFSYGYDSDSDFGYGYGYDDRYYYANSDDGW